MPAAHPPDVRRRALDLVAEGNPDRPTARDLGIGESCLRNWVNREAIDSGCKVGIMSTAHRELVELRRQNRVLVIEIEILTRASGYFARVLVLPRTKHGLVQDRSANGIPAAVACRFLNISTHGFYDWVDRPASA